MKSSFSIGLMCAALLVGCASSYTWRSSVPAEMRTVSVPTFANQSELMEIGALSTRQILREFQREGTFAIRPVGEAALEIQGSVSSVSTGTVSYNRRSWRRYNAYELRMTATVSVIDKSSGAILIDNKRYKAETTMTGGQDQTTSERDASGRLADDLARQIVDDVLNLKW